MIPFSILLLASAPNFVIVFGVIIIFVAGARKYFCFWRIVLFLTLATFLFLTTAPASIFGPGAQIYFWHWRAASQKYLCVLFGIPVCGRRGAGPFFAGGTHFHFKHWRKLRAVLLISLAQPESDFT